MEIIRDAMEKQKNDRDKKIKERQEKINENFSSENTGIANISIFCPVDVMVTDLDGNRIASIENDQGIVFEDTEKKAVISFCGDKKKIFIKNTEKVNINLTGTGDGMMQLSLARDILYQGAEEERKIFENVELYNGKNMHCTFDSSMEAEDIRLFNIDNEENEIAEIMPDGTDKDLAENMVEAEKEIEVDADDSGSNKELVVEAGEDELEIENTKKEEVTRQKILYIVIICQTLGIVFLTIVILLMGAALRKKKAYEDEL